MQQTDKYKFNIIETTDTFSPENLNENARTAEKELARVEAETASQLSALAQADADTKAALEAADAATKAALAQADAATKAALEEAAAANKSNMEAVNAALQSAIGTGGGNARIAIGSYVGKENLETLTFDFKPLLVVVLQRYNSATAGDRPYACVALVRGADNVYGIGSASSYLCSKITWTENSVTFGGDFIMTKPGLYAALGVSLDAEE